MAPGLRVGDARELVRGTGVVARAARHQVRRWGVAEALELVSGAAEPTCAALDRADLSKAGVVETLQLVLATAEPAGTLFDVVAGCRAVQTLQLVLTPAEPTNTGRDHRWARVLHALEALELVVRAAEPARALLDVRILSSDT